MRRSIPNEAKTITKTMAREKGDYTKLDYFFNEGVFHGFGPARDAANLVSDVDLGTGRTALDASSALRS
eukprot:10140565-Prorocentrum_lima.AAC.1